MIFESNSQFLNPPMVQTNPAIRARTCVAPPPTPQTESNHDGLELEREILSSSSMMLELISRLIEENQRLQQQLANDTRFISFRHFSWDKEMTHPEAEADEPSSNTGYLDSNANSAPESGALHPDTRSEVLSSWLENIPEHPLSASDQDAQSSENVIYNPSSDDPQPQQVQSITGEVVASPDAAIDHVDRQLESLRLDVPDSTGVTTAGSPDSSTRDTLVTPYMQLPTDIQQFEQMDKENTPESSNEQPPESAPEQPDAPSMLCQKLRLMIIETVGCQCRLCLLSSKDNFDNFTSLEVLQSHGAKNHTEKIANLINRLARVEATGDRV